jgi:4-hydroxymandelate oxidase
MPRKKKIMRAKAPACGPVCLADFEPLAKEKMSPMAWEYLSAGVADEITLRENITALQRIRLKPRVMVDVSRIDTRVELLGQERAFPILLAPTASQKMMHPEGELGTARGAAAAGATMVLSSLSNFSLEQVAKAAHSEAKTELWFQLYVQRDRELTRELVQRAERAGYRALVLTVDLPVLGARNREARACVKMPPLVHLKEQEQAAHGSYLPGDRDIYSPVLDASLNWKNLEWLLGLSKLPVLVKGVLNPDDAELAVKAGASGVIVSNHGGRNLDTLPATIDALPLVAERVRSLANLVPVLMDGGIRRGTDVLKALALGASAVLVGRPYVWGLAVEGASGVEKVVNILRRELEMAMALTGRPNIASIDRSVIWP